MTARFYPTAVRATPRQANTGGPMSRTRKEVIASTLLGRDDIRSLPRALSAWGSPFPMPTRWNSSTR